MIELLALSVVFSSCLQRQEEKTRLSAQKAYMSLVHPDEDRESSVLGERKSRSGTHAALLGLGWRRCPHMLRDTRPFTCPVQLFTACGCHSGVSVACVPRLTPL